ncbi:uncharacterized protein RMCC_6550 [Mycolicibacterium canariasense]|uniref:SPW repeat-containing integral membrane domain-containing protein n=1 Tax=Mycolicibacterium canariasense TaxID=228230 RepID=A0A124E3D1_MYCCR|nr:uncharacterized protein RMCC_6550 [Mycolicibacterium canariasense]
MCAAIASFAFSSTRVGSGFVFGFSAFVAFFGALTLLAHNRAPDHWGLFVVGAAMFVVPFVGNGYSYDRWASWTCWVAGGLAMILGGFAWTQDRTPTEYGITELGDSQRLRQPWSYWIGRMALSIGLASVLLGIAFRPTAAGAAVTIGLGGMIAVVAVWSLLASEPTHNFLTLAIIGLALFLSPWVAGFAGEKLAWVAWAAGAVTTALGVVGYVEDERLDFAAAVRDDSMKQYRRRYR